MQVSDPLLNDREAAAWLSLAVGTLRNWRATKRGPAYVKLGPRAVRYAESALARFVADGARDSRGDK